jgi:hypothetical protein
LELQARRQGREPAVVDNAPREERRYEWERAKQHRREMRELRHHHQQMLRPREQRCSPPRTDAVSPNADATGIGTGIGTSPLQRPLASPRPQLKPLTLARRAILDFHLGAADEPDPVKQPLGVERVVLRHAALQADVTASGTRAALSLATLMDRRQVPQRFHHAIRALAPSGEAGFDTVRSLSSVPPGRELPPRAPAVGFASAFGPAGSEAPLAPLVPRSGSAASNRRAVAPRASAATPSASASSVTESLQRARDVAARHRCARDAAVARIRAERQAQEQRANADAVAEFRAAIPVDVRGATRPRTPPTGWPMFVASAAGYA